jgi:mono/diheme cytochrome c family protein
MKATKLVVALAGAALIAGCFSDDPYVHREGSTDDGGPGPDPVGEDDMGKLDPNKGPQPAFGPTTSLDESPPPISGGTLIVSADGKTAFAADPDRDAIYVVDLASEKVTTVALSSHDEPGRLALDPSGRVHVALRRSGKIVTIDATGALVGRRAVCPAPRGITFDEVGARLVVVCQGGEVVALEPAADGAVTQLAQIDADLRDVVISGSTMYISRFRTAEILELDATGYVISRQRPTLALVDSSVATLGWRMIASPVKDAVPIMVHELASSSAVQPSAGGYGAPAFDPTACADQSPPGIVTPAVSTGDLLPNDAVLPVDIAANSSRFLVVAAGNAHTLVLPQIFEVLPGGPCGKGQTFNIDGQATAVAMLDEDRFIVQSREPARLVLMPEGKAIELSATKREDTGHAIFHSNSGSGIACASCHGEGGDDAHIWTFSTVGARRTPSLRGTLDGTAPYHWSGEMADISHLVDDVLSQRMQGPNLVADQKAALQKWLFALPAPTPASGVDAAAAARGKALFEANTTSCSSCHSGTRFTNSATVDVGTGGRFQVPSLVGVSARLPLMHAGCAATLEDRFGACATKLHGTTSWLSPAQIADLVAYLKTL